MRRPGAVLLAIALAGCTTRPLAPDPSVELSGVWRIVALNGRTISSPAYRAEFHSTYAAIATGCNSGSGEYRVANGWFTRTSDWIVTVAACSDETRQRDQHIGERILSQPLAIERIPFGIRLRNRLGSLDLQK